MDRWIHAYNLLSIPLKVLEPNEDNTFSFVADIHNNDRSRPPESSNNAVQQASKDLLPQMNREPIKVDDDLHCEALEVCQGKSN